MLVLLVQWFFLPTPATRPRFSPEKFSCSYHKCILSLPVICCSLLLRMYHAHIAIIQVNAWLLHFFSPVFLHYCSENVVPLCSALQMTGSTSRRMTALPGDLPIAVYAGGVYFRFGNIRPEWFLILMSLSNWHNAAVTLTCGKSRRNESFHSIHSIMKNSQTFLKFCT